MVLWPLAALRPTLPRRRAGSFGAAAVLLAIASSLGLPGSVTSQQAPLPWKAPITWDFETGDLRGWKAEGTAFASQPTLGDNPTARNRGQPSRHQGRWWIGTYERYQGRPGQQPGMVQGDGPTGTLTSAFFRIPGGTLSFLVGGGSGFETRVELWTVEPIEGDVRQRAASGADSETMRRVRWNLADIQGRTGYIRIVDDSSGGWGHINVDDFRFSAAPASPATGAVAAGSLLVAARPDSTLVSVPDLIGRDSGNARSELARLGLTVGALRPRLDTAPPGTVVDQAPAAATEARGGARVDLSVSRWVVVPRFVGRDTAEVAALAADLPLALAGGIHRRLSLRRGGTVLEQDPVEGKEVPPGSPLRVVVARHVSALFLGGTGLAVVLLAGGIILGIRKGSRTRDRRGARGADGLELVCRPDGAPRLEADRDLRGGPEMRWRAVADPGEQTIETPGPVIGEGSEDHAD